MQFLRDPNRVNEVESGLDMSTGVEFLTTDDINSIGHYLVQNSIIRLLLFD